MFEERKANILRVVNATWNEGNLDALDEINAPGYIRHRMPFADILGLDALKEYVKSIRSNYPDFHITIYDIAIDGDIVFTRWSWTGTHSGQSGDLPIPPTGKQVSVTGCSLARTQDGKAIEEWSFADNLGLLQQLGVVPSMR